MKAKTKSKKQRKQIHKSTEERVESNPAEFAFVITKVAVSQICRSVGFSAAQSSSLEILTLIATKYLQQLASTAASYSNGANRTESNLLDLTNALHDMSFEQGFVGASNFHHQSSSSNNNCLLNSSSILNEIATFVNYSSKEIPFAKPIPRDNKENKNSVTVSSKNELGRSRSLHIPKWLPAFPDERSYKGYDEMMVVKRSNNSKLWENSGMVKEASSNYGGGGGGEDVQNLNGDLSKERGKVRFKIGVKGKGGNNGVGIGVDIMRNGVCRGGKRVRWNVGDNDLIEGDEGKIEYKRRRC